MKHNDSIRFYKFAINNCWILVFPGQSVQCCCVLSATFLSPLTSRSDYLIMMCIVCHVDRLSACPPVKIVSYDCSLSWARSLCKKSMHWSMSYTIKNTFDNSKTVWVNIKIRHKVYLTASYDELPKWRCPIYEKHQQRGPKCK